MKLYRIQTENLNKALICEHVSNYFDGFSIYEQIGYWQGKAENSLCIEICAGDADVDKYKINMLCHNIGVHNSQQAVMLQIINIEMQLI